MFGAFLASVAKAVIPSLIVGAVKNKRDREAQKDAYNQAKKASANRFVDLRNAASKAGFNPLTALMGGGAPASPFMEPLLSNNFVADSLGEGLTTAFNYSTDQQKAEFDRERENLQLELMREELASAKRANADPLINRNFGYQLPQVERSGLLGPERVPPALSPDPAGSRDMLVGGNRLQVNTDTASAADFEDEYGDIASSVYGGAKLVRDSWNSMTSSLKKEWDDLDFMPFDTPNTETAMPLGDGFFGGSTYSKKSQR